MRSVRRLDNMDTWLKINRPVYVEADIPLKEEAPEKIKQHYSDYNWGDLIIWTDDEEGVFGCIRFNRSITMPLSELGSVELQEMKPGKGSGYVHLSFVSKEGKQLGGIYSRVCAKKSFDWLSEIQPQIAETLNVEQRFADHGYDA